MGSDRHRVELGGVQPRQEQPSRTEEGDEEEETESTTVGGLAGAFDEAAKCYEHGDGLTDGTDKEKLAPAHTLNEEEGGESKCGLAVSAFLGD